MPGEKKKFSPDRLTYHHSLAIKAGEKFMRTLIEENFPHDVLDEWIKEWVKQAKKKTGIGPIEFLAAKGDIDEAKILAWGARLSGTPIIDTEHVNAGNQKHFVIDGMPMTLLTDTDCGAVTLVHCLPFLNEFLDQDLVADIYGAVKINYTLAAPINFYRHLERLHSTGKAVNRILTRAEEEKKQSFEQQISAIIALGLLPPDFSKSSGRKEILDAMEENRPKSGGQGEVEWYSLTKGIPYVNLASISSSKELLEIVLPTTQKQYGIVPICEYGGTLTIASRRALRSSTRQELVAQLQKHCKINTVLGSSRAINDITTANLSAVISTTSISNQIKLETTPEAEDVEEIDISELAEGSDASVIKLVQSILIGAVNKRATDVHIATHPDRTWVRYRIDGNMVEAPFHLPFEFWKAVLSRIKIMSSIDIKYSPVPQDGKFPLAVGPDEYDIRVNTCPTVYGEKAILRLQRKDENVPTLESLGLYPHEKKLITDVVEGDHGLLIICGPTGSGKCLGKGTEILMYSGKIKKVENIQEGDLLMGPDSKPRKVLRTNNGKGLLYKIHPKKGKPWVCNDAHILTLKKGKKIKDICIKDFLKKRSKEEEILDWKLFRVPVDFDGEKGETGLESNCYLKGIIVGKKCNGDKPVSISKEVLYGTKNKRLNFLAGIIDEIGKIRKNRILIQCRSQKICSQIVFLARSIGIWAEAPNETRNGKAYQTYLEGITENLPCIKQKNRKIVKRDLISESAWVAKEIGKDQYYGFTLDGDGRFLLGDFTVTHNTTTLSATMYAIDRKRWNVITAENPVEIRIPHVEQTPIDGSQLTFAKFVPAALRQDPDYIMIGETRDKETTEEVIRAAITGHIVMTTLHTNSAAGAPGRLIDMGGQPFLITDALKTVCAQRLIRRLCPNCSRPVRKIPTKDELKRMHIDPKWIESAEYLLEPVGCKLCNNTGYKGRVAIVEGYFTSPEIRRIIIHDNADTEKIRREIEHQGGKTLFQHAVEHVARGTTSLAEALTVRNLDG
jgi:type II secretory ATPase GspE/PulE/Tfp pilus assembly ATPase PilB-like protein